MAAKKRKSSRRQKRGKSYFTRDARGRFKKFFSISRSLAADRRRKARKKTKSGFGHRGDR